jgi:hypothetical protein
VNEGTAALVLQEVGSPRPGLGALKGVRCQGYLERDPESMLAKHGRTRIRLTRGQVDPVVRREDEM